MTTTDQTLEWHISVDGVTKGGHPIQKIELNFGTAAQTFDQLVEQYPDRTVRMFQIIKTEIKSIKMQKRIGTLGPIKPLAEPDCPRGCSGKRDGRPVVIRTESGKVQCSICGYLG